MLKAVCIAALRANRG